MQNIKVPCHVCKGAGKRWGLNAEGRPIQLFCEYCEGIGGQYQTALDEDNEQYFIEFDCE